jgi:hypothetical protein
VYSSTKEAISPECRIKRIKKRVEASKTRKRKYISETGKKGRGMETWILPPMES